MIVTTILLVSMQFLEVEEGHTSINPLYLTLVSNAKCMKLFLLAFLNMSFTFGVYLLLFLSPEDGLSQEARSSRRMTGLAEELEVYTWDPNKELVILGQGT